MKLLKVGMMTSMLTVLKMIAGFIIAKLIAIYTGPSGIAMLGQMQSFVSSINGIANAPVGSGLIRFTAELKEEGNYNSCLPLWKASMQWLGFITLSLIIIVAFFSEYISDFLFEEQSLQLLIIISVLMLPLTAIGTLCNSVINGQEKFKRFVVTGIIATLINTTVAVMLIINHKLEGALISVSIQGAIIGITLVTLNFKQPWFKFKFWWGRTDKQSQKKIGGYILMALATALTMPTSLMIIRSNLVSQVGWELTGQWQAVWRISEVYLTIVTMTLSTYFLPKLASIKSKNEIIKEVHKTARLIIPTIMGFALLVYLMRDFVIAALFTSEFGAASDLFAIQLCGDVIKIASWLYAYPMISRGATNWFIGSEVVFSCLFVVLSFVFSSYLGVKGVTVAYLVNYIICLTFMFLNLKRFSS